MDNHIVDSTGVGIQISMGSDAHIFDNVLHSTSGNWAQIHLNGGSTGDISDNTITASSGGGIGVAMARSAQIGGNNVSGTASDGIGVGQVSHVTLTSPNTVNNPGGVAKSCISSRSLIEEAEQITMGYIDLAPECDLHTPDVTFP